MNPPLRQRVFPTHASFQEEAIKHYGPGELGWKFRCPKCKCVHTLHDWFQVYPEDTTVWARRCLDCGYENPGKLPILVKVGSVEFSCFEFDAVPENVVLSRPKTGGLGLF